MEGIVFPYCPYLPLPPRPWQPSFFMDEFPVAVSLQDFFRYYSMKDKTEYRVYNAELETKRDLIKKGKGLRGGRGRKERKS